MKITEELLNEYSNGLQFKLRSLNDNSSYYSIEQNGDYIGVISFRDYGYYDHNNNDNINIIGLFMDKVKSGLGTEVIKLVCDCGKKLNADNVIIWHPYNKKIFEYDNKGKKRKYTRRKRVRIYKKIGKTLDKKVSYNNESITYRL